MILLSVLLQSSTPNTVPYLIVGYVIMGGIGLVYVISLLVRQSNLKRDIQVIASLAEDED